jgi:hypothetical protein
LPNLEQGKFGHLRADFPPQPAALAAVGHDEVSSMIVTGT